MTPLDLTKQRPRACTDAEARAQFHHYTSGTESVPDSETILSLIDAWDDEHWGATAR